MALTITEANAVNVVLRHLLDDTDDSAGRLQEAAELLANKANKTLGAGLTVRDIRIAFEAAP